MEEEKNENIRCPVCNGESTIIVYQNPKQPIFSQGLVPKKTKIFMKKKKLSISFCSQCNHVFNTSRDLSELDELYKKFYTYIPSNLSQPDIDFKKELAQFLSSRCRKGRVLEIGSHDGYFLHLLNMFGWKCEGIDPSPASEVAMEKYSLKILKEYFSSKFYDQKFDLVVLRHILEHVDDPISFILDIKNVLKERGYIFVEVPNLMKSIKERNYHDFYFEHLSYFTPPFLKNLLINCGFNITEVMTMRNDEVICCLSKNTTNSKKLRKQDIARALIKNRNDLTLFKELTQFSEESKSLKEILSFIHKSLAKRERWVVWGAGAAGINLISSLGLTEKEIEFAIDSDRNKWGRFLPGSGLRVYSPKLIKEKTIHVVFIISNLYQNEIKENLKWFVKKGGKLVGLHPTFGYIS